VGEKWTLALLSAARLAMRVKFLARRSIDGIKALNR